MRKIIVIMQLTLDGVMQAPGGPDEDRSNGFRYGGWMAPFGDEVLRKAIADTIAGDFDLLLGRRTYDIWAGYWPLHVDNLIGAAFAKATKYVVTKTLKHLGWDKAERIDGDVVAKVRQIRESNGPELHVWGSGNLLQTLIAADLIDEYRIWLAPVVIGEGKRLFEKGVPPRGLALVETRGTPSGIVISTYRPAGRLQTGTIEA
jgi:dihydrofolate reductase